ncbi:946_t:CDS:2 [Rhizophagus irregularis]|nr:946_t:CDS:2 [Rhizophagus irregularis]
MSHSIANTSTSISASRLPTVEEINGWNNIPIIIGSEILPDDDIKVFRQNCVGREKGVNNFITLKIAKMIYTESPDILVLIARDGDYYGTLLEAIDYKWKIKILEIGVLDQFKLSTLLFPIGVSGHLKVEDKEIVEWFANLNLFSWIHQKGNNIILYLNNKKELNVAKEWIVRKHKEISI